ncbi:MAG TPA: hypothetical protein VJC18_09705 [bacterium]|nr:hypothetical protein [bacterium]
MNYTQTLQTKTDDLAKHISNCVQAISDQAFRESLAQRLIETLHHAVKSANFWEVALLLGGCFDDVSLSTQTRDQLKTLLAELRAFQGVKALASTQTALVVFGTSGWRDRIGEGMTVLNVHRVVRAIINTMQGDDYLQQQGYSSFDVVKKKGIVLMRDNRYLGDVFLTAAKKELVQAQVKVHEAGECPTGVGSALVTELGAAGSINFTPSHNPMDWAGIKFNPADGGPAGTNITTMIDAEAAKIMEDKEFAPAEPSTDQITTFCNAVDAKKMYREFILKSKNFDLLAIQNWLLAHKGELLIVVDYFHGSARGFVESLLGEELVAELQQSQAIEFWHTNDDVSFGGKKPEPSAQNQRPLMARLKGSGRRFTLGVFMDPDADRIRLCDASLDIEVNLFGPIMYANMLATGQKGGVVSTVASSDFALTIARENQQEVFETAVGFKWFREHFKSGRAIIGFEESDGISFGDTLEKDALAGLLGALMIWVRSGENLSTQYERLQKRYGYYYPQKTGIDLKGITPAQWLTYQKKVLGVLLGGLLAEGQKITVGESEKTIIQIMTDDGLKLVFDDHSWILMRPSGTEPKFRIYYEITSAKALSGAQLKVLMDSYCQAGQKILQKARDHVAL